MDDLLDDLGQIAAEKDAENFNDGSAAFRGFYAGREVEIQITTVEQPDD